MQNTSNFPVLKGNPPFYYGGGEMDRFFKLQNAKSRDWSVVGSSNLFWHTIWTHPALLGCAPRRKVCAPMRHMRLKKNWSKMSIFEPKWIRMCLVSANHVGRACTPGMCQARSGVEKDGIYTFLAPLELKLRPKMCKTSKMALGAIFP